MKYCNCKNILEEGGNCICTDCNCHYYKRIMDNNDKDDDNIQKLIRNYSIGIIGSTTILYGIYFFCCENHLHII